MPALLSTSRDRWIGPLWCLDENAVSCKDGSTVRYASIFAKKYGTLVRYAFFVVVRVRYVGTLFELKIPRFYHIAPAFCMQRQKAAEADAICEN